VTMTAHETTTKRVFLLGQSAAFITSRMKILKGKPTMYPLAWTLWVLMMSVITEADEGLTLVIHRNGEPDPCGVASVLKNKIGDVSKIDNKYKMESFLTDLVAETMNDKSSCVSSDNYLDLEGIHGFCDMGKDHTPVLLDDEKLVRVKRGTLPCRWYTREGIRVVSFDQLESLAAQAPASSETCSNPTDDPNLCQGAELHLYAVQAGRVFMFAPSYIGESFELDHLSLVPNPENPISMKVLVREVILDSDRATEHVSLTKSLVFLFSNIIVVDKSSSL
jgi:hypothetical protein